MHPGLEASCCERVHYRTAQHSTAQHSIRSHKLVIAIIRHLLTDFTIIIHPHPYRPYTDDIVNRGQDT